MICGRTDEGCTKVATRVCSNMKPHAQYSAPDGKAYRCESHKKDCCQLMCGRADKDCKAPATYVCTNVHGAHSHSFAAPDGKVYRCEPHRGACCTTKIAAATVNVSVKGIWCGEHQKYHQCRWCHDTKLYSPLVGPSIKCTECK